MVLLCITMKQHRDTASLKSTKLLLLGRVEGDVRFNKERRNSIVISATVMVVLP